MLPWQLYFPNEAYVLVSSESRQQYMTVLCVHPEFLMIMNEPWASFITGQAGSWAFVLLVSSAFLEAQILARWDSCPT